MKKQDFINKWIGWVSYSDREKLAIEMESDLQEIEKELSQDKWIKIESEKDLPKEKGLKCLFLCIHGNTTYISDDVLEDPKWFANKYSHWRLKDEIKDPILKVQNSK